MSRVLIADDHVVLRQGIKALLNGISDIEVVGEANDGFEVMSLVDKVQPDIILLDLSMPNLGGVETIARLQSAESKPVVLVLSAKDDEVSVSNAMTAGARGFLPKTVAREELEFAIRSVCKGQTYLSPSVCGRVLTPGKDGEHSANPLQNLSHREREVMKLLAEGRPNRDVAKMLHISPRTIDTHRSNIMKKLGIASNAELVQLAIRHGLVE